MTRWGFVAAAALICLLFDATLVPLSMSPGDILIGLAAVTYASYLNVEDNKRSYSERHDEGQARRLREGLTDGWPAAPETIRNWLGRIDADRRATVLEWTDTALLHHREHGFPIESAVAYLLARLAFRR